MGALASYDHAAIWTQEKKTSLYVSCAAVGRALEETQREETQLRSSAEYRLP